MKSERLVGRLVVLLGIGACVVTSPAAAAPPAATLAEQSTQRAVVEMLDRMPLLFVPEQVPPDGAMGYAVRGSKTSIWLSEAGIAYRLQKGGDGESKEAAESWVVALDLVGATPRQPVGEDLLPTKVSYFKGPKDQWRTGLPSYGSLRYREPWPGVDAVVSGRAGELETTFVVRPGADPGLIRLAYRGATAVRLGPGGSLVADTPLGSITEQAPVAYQEIDGQRFDVAAAFELEKGLEPGRQPYRFRLGEYDRSRELVVDPVTLVYCGYLGGADIEGGWDIAVDAVGNAYVTGHTESTEATFPVTVGPDLSFGGGDYDSFVAKVNATGTALDYCGYIGGSGIDMGAEIAVDAHGSAYVVGTTTSTEATFPVTVGPDLTYGGNGDSFVAKVNATGTALDYCGYIGGSGYDEAISIDVDGAGDAYVAGATESSEATFPVAAGPDLTFNGYTDAFVAKVNAAGTALDYCGYIGGADNDAAGSIRIDGAGSAYVTGPTASTNSSFPVTVGPDLSYNGGDSDGFVAKVNASGTALVYCGYIGGSTYDYGRAIAVDAAGNAYVGGFTDSTEASFPVTVGPDLSYNGGDYDAFIARVNTDGTALDYCGFIGGAGSDWIIDIAVSAAGNAYLTGRTQSDEASFPVTGGPDPTHNGGRDAFVARVNTVGSGLDFCGYIGGSSSDGGSGIAVDRTGNAYIAGYTTSTEASFPVTVGPDLSYNGGDMDAFVAKVSSPDLLFWDGFESGDTSAWSATVP